VTWIRTLAALEQLARSLESCRAIGLDTESDSLYHHKDKVCLVQIATDRGEAYLVDTLAVDPRPLGPAMASPALV
jgi:ribonuclease D